MFSNSRSEVGTFLAITKDTTNKSVPGVVYPGVPGSVHLKFPV
jgi:hypothetical protein